MKAFLTFVLTFLAGYLGEQIGYLFNADQMLCILCSVSTAGACIVGFLGAKDSKKK